MQLLHEFNEVNLKIGKAKENYNKKYKFRKAARAVVFNNENKVAILFDPSHNHHKIPGGGIEQGETILEALKREIKEEARAKIKLISEIGITIEYRDKHNLIQISYCWLGKTVGKVCSPQFDKEEIADGMRLEWVTLETAVKLFKKDKPIKYNGPFMQARDMLFY